MSDDFWSKMFNGPPRLSGDKLEAAKRLFELRDEDKAVQQILIELVQRHDLEYVVNGWAMNGFRQICARFDPFHNPGDGWTNGADLELRWQTTSKALAKYPPLLPMYMWNWQSENMERIEAPLCIDFFRYYDEFLELQSDSPRTMDNLVSLCSNPIHMTPEALWYFVPAFWWFKENDLQFYEKLEHEKAIKYPENCREIKDITGLDITKDWLSPREVLERWPGITLSKLENHVKDKELKLYRLSPNHGIHRVSEDNLSRQNSGLLGGALLDGCLFKLADIKEFQKAHSGVLKRKAQKVSRVEENPNFKRAIEFARQVKQKFPRITIDDLAHVTYSVLTYRDREFDDAKCEHLYSGARNLKRVMFSGKKKPAPSTVRAWFRREKAFPHKAGRPSKQSQ